LTRSKRLLALTLYVKGKNVAVDQEALFNKKVKIIKSKEKRKPKLQISTAGLARAL